MSLHFQWEPFQLCGSFWAVICGGVVTFRAGRRPLALRPAAKSGVTQTDTMAALSSPPQHCSPPEPDGHNEALIHTERAPPSGAA